MNRAAKVIALTMSLTGGLWVYSYASSGNTDTYVSRRGSTDAAWDGPSSILLAQQMEDSTRVRPSDSLKLKDPNMALLYAVIPGVVIHGSGHFYAGKTKTGVVLLGSELVGGTIFYIGGLDKAFSQSKGGKLGIYGDIFIAFGGVLFVGSWIYDLVGAPLAVQRENRELLGGENVGLRFGFDQKSHSVRVQIVKRF